MSSYSERYRSPSPLFPGKTCTTLERLLASWERLRELGIHGYRTSRSAPVSTWLVDIAWRERQTHRSPGRGTTCSPFVTQATAMAFSESPSEPLRPLLADGTPLPFLFSQMANGVLRSDNPAYRKVMNEYGVTMADNEWPRPVIFFNMGYAVELTELRRGDAVHIDWQNGGGHAVFCWDVHLNERGEVDAFQYVSSNGKMANGGSGGGIAVGGTTDGSGGFIGARLGSPTEYFAARRPLFVDHPNYVTEGTWVTWDPAVAARPLGGLCGSARRRAVLAKRVKAARFHGVEVAGIPLFAMGQGEAAMDSEPAVEPPRATEHASDGLAQTAALQERLHLLFGHGLIDCDPGTCDGKAGRHTTAAVKAFQHRYGLKADGVAGPATLALIERVCRSATAQSGAPDPAAGPAAAQSFASGGDFTDSAQLYFRHGVARPGEVVELILRGDALPHRPLAVTLHHSDAQGLPIESPLHTLMPVNGGARIHVRVPWGAGGSQLVARLRDADLETPAPLYVLPAREALR